MLTSRISKLGKIVWVFALILVLAIQQIDMAIAQSISLYYNYKNNTPIWAGGAINGTNGVYGETQVIPHYIKAIDLLASETYGFNLVLNYYQNTSQSCGLLYLDTYNASITNPTPLPGTDPTTGTPFPMSAGGSKGDMIGINVQTGTFSLSVDPVYPTPEGGTPTADNYKRFKIEFSPATDGTVEFYFGIYIATDDECYTVGNDFNGAGNWTGASLQSGISKSPTITGIDPDNMIEGGGTLSFNSGGIVPADILGMKFFDVDGDGQYEPGTTPPNADYPLSGWTINLYDCSDAVCTLKTPNTSIDTDANGNYIFSGLTDGNYYQVCEVLETDSPKWEVTSREPPSSTNPADIIPTASGEACFDVFQYSAATYPSYRYDFGNWLGPTAVTLTNFSAQLKNQAVLVNWQTGIAAETLGFNLYRSLLEDGSDKALLANLDVDFDNIYEYTDNSVSPGEVYYYWLEALYLNGSSELFGPYAAGYLNRVFLPVSLNKPQSIYPYSGE